MTDAPNIQTCLAQVSQTKDLARCVVARFTYPHAPFNVRKQPTKPCRSLEWLEDLWIPYQRVFFTFVQIINLTTPQILYPCLHGVPTWPRTLICLKKSSTMLLSWLVIFYHVFTLIIWDWCLGLYSLFCWRQRGDLIEAFKFINNLFDTMLSFPMLNNAMQN